MSTSFYFREMNLSYLTAAQLVHRHHIEDDHLLLDVQLRSMFQKEYYHYQFHQLTDYFEYTC